MKDESIFEEYNQEEKDYSLKKPPNYLEKGEEFKSGATKQVLKLRFRNQKDIEDFNKLTGMNINDKQFFYSFPINDEDFEDLFE